MAVQYLCHMIQTEYNRFQIGCVFAKYGLFNTITFIQNSIYINFRINLTQYLSISRDRNIR